MRPVPTNAAGQPQGFTQLPRYGNPGRPGVASGNKKDPTALQQWWQKEEAITKVLAVVGGLITLIGLVFLATLAYASGILGPESSVILAAIIALLVFGLAFRAHANRPAGFTAPAMLTVAVLAMLADVWVIVYQVKWLSEISGAVLTTVICIVGLVVARAWDKEKLGILLTVLSPLFITPFAFNILQDAHSSLAIPGCVIATALAAFASRWDRSWPGLHGTACAVFTLGILLTWDQPLWTFAASGLGVAILLIFAYRQPRVSRGLNGLAWITFLLAPLFAAHKFHVMLVVFEAIVFALILIWATTQQALVKTKQPTSVQENAFFGVYTSATALALALVMGYSETEIFWYACGFLLVCGTIIVLFPTVHTEATNVAGAAASILAAPFAVRVLMPAENPSTQMFDTWLILVVACAVLGLYLFKRRGTYAAQAPELESFTFAILAVASAIVVATLLLIKPGETSFMIGHMLISIAWIVLGIALISRGQDTTTRAGLVLVLVAVAKLVLFDLSILGGLVQVLAFIISGALLLIAAFQREKLFGKKQATPHVQNPHLAGTAPHPNGQRTPGPNPYGPHPNPPHSQPPNNQPSNPQT